MNEDILKAMAFESVKISVVEESKISNEIDEKVIAKHFYEKFQSALGVLKSLELEKINRSKMTDDNHNKLNPFQI